MNCPICNTEMRIDSDSEISEHIEFINYPCHSEGTIPFGESAHYEVRRHKFQGVWFNNILYKHNGFLIYDDHLFNKLSIYNLDGKSAAIYLDRYFYTYGMKIEDIYNKIKMRLVFS